MKELAKRLAGRYEVTVVAYGRLPEQVAGVETIAVDKRRRLLPRLAGYTRALRRAARKADVVYAVNGASVELPAIFVALTSKTPLVIGIADPAAHEHASKSLPLHMLERIARTHARTTIEEMPLPRPEINPLMPAPSDELAAYEQSWAEHIALLEGAFNHVN
jgi:hypothetical protein